MFNSWFNRFFTEWAGTNAPKAGIDALTRLGGKTAGGAALGMGINFGYNTVSGDSGGYGRAAALGGMWGAARAYGFRTAARKSFTQDLNLGYSALKSNKGSAWEAFKTTMGFSSSAATKAAGAGNKI